METNEFDENEAIKFIREFVPTAMKSKYSDDDILLLMDTMYDLFENGDDQDSLYDDDDESNGYNVNKIVNYVKKNLRKDPDNQIDMDDVKILVEGELEYENTLEQE